MNTNSRNESVNPRHPVLRRALPLALALAFAPAVQADYLATETNRIFLDPASIPVVVDGGYELGDELSYIMETTPRDSGSDAGNAAWLTIYVPDGIEITGAEFVQQAADGSFYAIPAEDPSPTYDGWGARGQKHNYDGGALQAQTSYINQFHQESGVYYSTHPKTALVRNTVDPRTGEALGIWVDPVGKDAYPGYGWVDGTGVPRVHAYNKFDFDQTVAFGEGNPVQGQGATPVIAKGCSTTIGDGTTGCTPWPDGSIWAGTGVPVAGPQTYFTNDYDPNCVAGGPDPLNTGTYGTAANWYPDMQCVGPWQRVKYPESRIGGVPGTVQPATLAGAINWTGVYVDGAAPEGDGIPGNEGWELSSSNPLPAGGYIDYTDPQNPVWVEDAGEPKTNAVRIALGTRTLGDLELARITFRVVKPTEFKESIYPAATGYPTFCMDNLPSDTDPTKDNNWRYFEPMHGCFEAVGSGNLLKQVTHINGVESNGQNAHIGDIVSYKITFTNTSLDFSPLTDVVISDQSLTANIDLIEPDDPTYGSLCAYSSYDAIAWPPGPARTPTQINGDPLASPPLPAYGVLDPTNLPVYDSGSAAASVTAPGPDCESGCGNRATWSPKAPSDGVNLMFGESITYFMCGRITGGVDGDNLFNEAQARFDVTIDGNPVDDVNLFSAAPVVIINGGSVEGNVYADATGNDVIDGPDIGIGGVTVELYEDLDGDGILDSNELALGPLLTTTTAPDGSYVFGNVDPGDYLIRELDPAGYTSTADYEEGVIETANCGAANDSTTDCNVISITVVPNTNSVNNDFLDQPPESAINYMSGTVYNDFDEDQSYDPAEGELGQPGVIVELYRDLDGDGQLSVFEAAFTPIQTATTDADGDYEFLILEAGDFITRVRPTTLPGGSSLTTDNVETASFPGTGYTDTDNDFGFSDANSALTIVKTSDVNYIAIPGQVITYTMVVTNTSATTQTGVTLWDGLPAGTDYVSDTTTATWPGGTLSNYGDGDQLSNGIPPQLVLAADNVDLATNQVLTVTFQVKVKIDIDTIAIPNIFNAAVANSNETQPIHDTVTDPVSGGHSIIGDFVWFDADLDGVQDGGEPGIGGVELCLYSSPGGVKLRCAISSDGATDVDGDGTIDPLGYYSFPYVEAGSYTVDVTDSTVPFAHTLTTGPDTETDPSRIVTVDGEATDVIDDVDFGYGVPVTNATIGDFVWDDYDGDGVQDPGEPGIANVTIDLYSADGTTYLTTVTTDSNGFYSVSVPDGFAYTLNVTDTNNVLSGGGYEQTWDFDDLTGPFNTADSAVTTVVGTSEVLDTVDFGYQRPSSLSVVKTSGIPENAYPGQVIPYTITITNNTATTQTGITLEDAVPAGTTYVAESTVATGPTNVAGTSTSDNFEAGLVYNGGSGDWVGNWQELGDDGSATGGDIRVVADSGDNSLRIQNKSKGAYRVLNLLGYTSANLSLWYRRQDGNGANKNMTIAISTDSNNGSNGTWATLGTIVLDGTDATYQNFTADISAYIDSDTMIRFLNNADNDKRTFIDDIVITTESKTSQTLDNDPATAIGALADGTPGDGSDFLVTAADGFILETGDTLTVTFDVLVDNPVSETSILNLAIADSNESGPAYGVVVDPVSAGTFTIGDLVWFDDNDNGTNDSTDGDGIFNGGELGLPGVEVCLYQDNDQHHNYDGDLLQCTITDASGNYTFYGVPAGLNYYVDVTDSDIPFGYITGPNSPQPDASNYFDVSASIDTIDFGFIVDPNSGELGDFIWNDYDADGVQDPGEPGIANVTVAVYADLNQDGILDQADIDNGIVGSATTDANGEYSVPGLTPGKYITVVTDDNSVLSAYDQTYDLDDGTTPFATPDYSGAEVVALTPNDLVDFGYYVPSDLSVTKVSDVNEGADVYPGEYITYTIQVTNDSLVRQTGITVTDTLPSGVTYVAGSTVASGLIAGDWSDNFESASYSGGTGTWLTGWIEEGDDGVSSTGNVSLVVDTVPAAGNDVLRLKGGNADRRGIYRALNLSGFTSAALEFDYRRVDNNSDDFVYVEVCTAGASCGVTNTATETDNWTVVATIGGNVKDTVYQHADSTSFPGLNLAPALLGANTRIRFRTDSSNDKQTYFDNLTLTATAGTVIKDNVSGGSNPDLADGTLGDGTEVLVAAGDGYVIDPGENLTVTFQVQVDPNIDAGQITAIVNTVTADSNESGPAKAVEYDPVSNGASTIGDFVFFDSNGDGYQAGEEGLGGVEVCLRDNFDNSLIRCVITSDGQPGTDVDGDGVDDPLGYYAFPFLEAGNYNVEVTASTLPFGYVSSPGPESESSPVLAISVDGTNATSDNTVDFGYEPDPNAAVIGDFVWEDLNGDGVQDPGEPGIGGVVLKLYASDGTTLLATTTTDADGNYSFEGVPTGTYYVDVTDEGTVPSGALTGGVADPTEVVVNTTVTLIYDEVDFGYFTPSDLSVVKTSDITGDITADGQFINYTIVVSNDDKRQTGITVVDPIPAGTTYVLNSTVVTGDVFTGSITLDSDFDSYTGGDPYPVGTTTTVGTLGGGWASTVWTEEGDDAKAGGADIRLIDDPDGIPTTGNKVLRFNKKPDNGLYRSVDLSPYNTATVSFDWRRKGLDNIDDVYYVEVCTAGASCAAANATDPTINWTVLKAIDWTTAPDESVDGTDDEYQSTTVSLTAAQITADTRIRVRSGPSVNQEIYFDNFVIYAEHVETVTKDNISGGTYADLVDGEPENLVVSGDNFMLESALSAPVTITKRVTASTDDAEEMGPGAAFRPEGAVYTTSTDLEMVDDIEPATSGNQTVGIRFTSLAVPVGAIITDAFITFRAVTADSPNTNNNTANLTIRGQDIDSAATFVESSIATLGISSRSQTSAVVGWTPPTTWTAGSDYDTPDLTAVVQEIVDRAGWASGNHIAFIIEGTGSRSAASWDGDSANAPLLTVTYSMPTTPTTMTITYQVKTLGLDSSFENITNIATADSNESQPASGAVVDPVNFPGGVIGNRVWLDENGDGKQDAGEDGIANVTVTLTGTTAGGDPVNLVTKTDTEGNYIFTDLPEGTYTVTVASPSDMDVTYDEDAGWAGGAGTPDNATTISLGDDEEHLTADFGYNWVPVSATDGGAGTGAIGDYIWSDADFDGVQDPGEIGIAGVDVKLYADLDGDGLYTDLIDTATTDATGHYIFDDVPPDAYVLQVDTATLPSGYNTTPTGDPDGDLDDTSEPFVLAPGDVYLNGDWGFKPDPSLADVEGTIYMDSNANADYENGDTPIAGVTVALVDNAGNIIATSTTDDTGKYKFYGIPAGDYDVVVTDTDNVIGDKTQTEEWNGGAGGACGVTCDSIADITVVGNADVDNVDFGYTPTGHTAGEGLIAGTVVLDTLDNNAVDPSDESLEGIKVELIEDGEVIAVTYTDENGDYAFGSLDPAGTYEVRLDPASFPDGASGDFDYNGSPSDSSAIIDLDANGGIVTNADFGLEGTNTVSGTIWNDANADGTLTDGSGGTANETGAGIAGVTVVLLDSNGNVVATTLTDASGNYSFTNMPNGTFTVDVTDDFGVLTGQWLSDGPNDGADNNSQVDGYTVTLTGGTTTNTTADFGYYDSAASLGNTVWNDVDGDGILDAGETGIAGVEVTLTITYPGPDGIVGGANSADDTVVTVTTVTDSNGEYSFDGLLLDEDYNGAGTGQPVYSISSATPSGMITTYDGTPDTGGIGAGTDLNADDDSGELAYPEQGGTDATNDFGFVFPASISGIAWQDLDGDGVQEGGEPVLAGVTVSLLDAAGNPVLDSGGNPITAVTAGDGSYSFTGLLPGTYTVDFGTATRYERTAQDQGGDDTLDSDADPDTGWVFPVTVAAGENLGNVDAGYVPLGALSGTVWFDADNTGTFSGGDTALEGRTVDLYVDANGDGLLSEAELAAGPYASTVTDASGFYEFLDVPIGTYVAVEQDLAGFFKSIADGDQSVEGGEAANASQFDNWIPVTVEFGLTDSGNDFLDAVGSTTAINDDNNTMEAVPVSGDVLFNDWDLQGDDQTVAGFLVDSDGDGVYDTAGTLGSPTVVSGYDANGNFVANAGTLDLNPDGTYTYIPADGFIGKTTVEYEACDDGTPKVCDTAELTITVEPLKDPWDDTTNATVANDDDNVSYGDPVSGHLHDNDYDPEGDTFNTTGWEADVDGDGVLDSVPVGSTQTVYGTDPNGNTVVAGTLQLLSNGQYIYTPCTDGTTPVAECDGAFYGTLAVDYENTDANGATDTATLTIEVLNETDEYLGGTVEENDRPVAGDDLAITDANTPVSGDVLDNDIDPNNDTITLVQVFDHDSGTWKTINGATTFTTEFGEVTIEQVDGTAVYTYTPDTDYAGPDRFSYQICDDGTPQLCDQATAYLVVLPAMDFGDLPDLTLPNTARDVAWRVLCASNPNVDCNAARHFVFPGLRIGQLVDTEADGQPNIDATGDGADDSDGTTYAAIGPDVDNDGTDIDQGETSSYTLGVEVQNKRGRDAVLVGWIDWNCDGIMSEPGDVEQDVTERARIIVDGDGNLDTDNDPTTVECDLGADGEGACALTWGAIDSPTPLMSFQSWESCGLVEAGSDKVTYARLRLSTEPEFFTANSPSPNGRVRDGEVQDAIIFTAAATTPVMITDVRATALAGGGAEVAWTTASELGAVAFRLERQDGNAWKKVNPSGWIPARLEIQGATYRVLDEGAEEGETYVYRIVEQTSKGRRITYGPYEVPVEVGNATADEPVVIEERFDYDGVVRNLNNRSEAQRKLKSKPPRGGNAPDTLRVLIAETGLYGLTVAELAEAFDTDEDQIVNRLRRGEFLLSSRGQEVPWYEQDGVLYFYGQGADNRYSATRTYWLKLKTAGTLMPVLDVAAAEAPAGQTYYATGDAEQENLWWLSLSTDPEDDYWFWSILSPWSPTLTVNLPVPSSQPADGELKLRLWGASNSTHRLKVRTASGLDLGQVSFIGNVEYATWEPLTIPAAALGGDELELELVLEPAPTGSYSSVLVDGFEFSWLRSYASVGDRIVYPAEGATGIDSLTTDAVITLDVIDPDHPRWVTGGELVDTGGSFRFQAELPFGEYTTVATTAVLKPVSMELDDKSDLRGVNNRADYVVITHAELAEAANALASYRSNGLRTMVVDIQDVYDEYTDGEPYPWALQLFAKSSQGWRTVPKYFTIFGDGSFDYRDINRTEYNFVSPRMYGSSNGLFASDTLLGDLDDDGRPEVAFGRIPVKSEEEGLAYVAKLQAYEAGIGDLPNLLVADLSDKGGDFTYSTLRVEQQVDGLVRHIDLKKTDIDSAREQFDSELDEGLRMINFLGHAATDRLSGQGRLGLVNNIDVNGGTTWWGEEIQAMDNSITPAFVGLSCLINNYSIPGWDGLGERLVVEPDAGMVATWAATGESYNDQATELGVEFHRIEGNYERLGDAIIATLQARPYLVPVYTLLGDPATLIQ